MSRIGSTSSLLCTAALAGIVTLSSGGAIARADVGGFVLAFDDSEGGCDGTSQSTCTPSVCSSDFTFTFDDPLPAGAQVNALHLDLYGSLPAGSTTLRVELNGQLVQQRSVAGGCAASDHFQRDAGTGEIPGYHHGGINVVRITTVYGSYRAVRGALAMFYASCGNGMVEPGETCDDGNALYCDACSPSCTPLAACPDDGNLCTDVVCNPATGCGHADNTAPCDDGDACTVGDACTGGVCGAGAPVDCDDGDVCTADACVLGGCSHDPIPGCCTANAECDDSDPCTRDTCSGPGGSCSQSPVTGCCEVDADCDDDNPCTADTCDPTTGECSSDAIDDCCVTAGDCDDGDPCTANACAGHRCLTTPLCIDSPGTDAGVGAGIDAGANPMATPDADLIEPPTPALPDRGDPTRAATHRSPRPPPTRPWGAAAVPPAAPPPAPAAWARRSR